jgi:hypothetical protein
MCIKKITDINLTLNMHPKYINIKHDVHITLKNSSNMSRYEIIDDGVNINLIQ